MKGNTAMKVLLKVLVLVGVLGIIAVVMIGLSVNALVKAGVEKMGSRVLGVPVTVEDVDISLPSGGSLVQANLKQLVIQNPEGYETAHAFSFPNVQVRVNWKSLLSDTVVVEEVLIAGPSITFERLRLGNNLSAIQSNVKRNVRSGSDEEHDEEGHEERGESGKNVHIKTVTVKDAGINVSLFGGKSNVMQLPLPDLELHDIGKSSGGIRESAARIFDAMYAAILKAVTKSGELIPKDLKQLGKSATDLGKSVEEAGKKLLKGLFKK